MSPDTQLRPALVVPPDFETGRGRAFLDRLDAVLSPRAGEIILDCSRLVCVNSSQVNMLWIARERCEAMGIPLHLIRVTIGLERVLQVLDIYDLFVAGGERAAEAPEPAPAETAAKEPDEGAGESRAAIDTRRTFEVDLEASERGVSEAMSAFREFLDSLNLPEVAAFDLGTVFYEVATNIRQHGGLATADRSTFTATFDDHKVTLQFADSGRPFDPQRDSPSFDAREAIKRRQHRGIGLVMVRRLVDSISYERAGDRNIVRLEKSLRRNKELGQCSKEP